MLTMICRGNLLYLHDICVLPDLWLVAVGKTDFFLTFF